MRPRIYVSGPITKGDRQHNLRQAEQAGQELISAGFAPLIPQLTMHLPYAWEVEHSAWIDLDLSWVAVSQAVLRLPGESLGADLETDFAFECGVPVYHDIESLRKGFGL